MPSSALFGSSCASLLGPDVAQEPQEAEHDPKWSFRDDSGTFPGLFSIYSTEDECTESGSVAGSGAQPLLDNNNNIDIQKNSNSPGLRPTAC